MDKLFLDTQNTKIQTVETVDCVNRIVIGDVGSGKTIVALLTALTYLKGLPISGQVCLLAPTEVLAYQHYMSLQKLLADCSNVNFDWLDIVFLASKNILVNKQKVTKKRLEKYLQENSKKIFWIGTHALLHNSQISPDLVMVDEQHRFGVEQRKKLSQNTVITVPHFISFTATPIPRTLALTLYDTLKPIFLERLKGRTEILTSINYFTDFQTQTVSKIKNHLKRGRKIYVICAKVQNDEDDEEEELWSVSKAARFLEKFFTGQIMLVHGKMLEKKDILNEFKESKEKNILVATTVIEVGVDVGLASLVVVLNAERFGLSALHQIRGRVGRNNFNDNECILVTYPKYGKSRRLRYLCESQDGFEIAEKDLEIRGAGDIFGKVQSGFGDEIDKIIGLNPKLYQTISQEVKKLDFDNLNNLPRLKKYLEKRAAEIWKE